MKLDELARLLDAELCGDGSVEVGSVAPLDEAVAGQLSFVTGARYLKSMGTTAAAAVITPRDVSTERIPQLKVKDVYFALSQAIVALHGLRQHPFKGVDPRANVHPTASIGEGSTIYPGAFVGENAKVGRDTIIYANAVIYDHCVIGDRCIIHGGAVIGADGYGFAFHNGAHHKIPQVGIVIIEDDVEVGPNTTISRAALTKTVIGKGTKIDQQVIIGHNVRIGQHCLLVAQVAIAGSVQIGNYVTIAGQAGVAGHLKIGDRVIVGAQSGVMQDLPEPGTYIGTPAMPFMQSRRVVNIYTQLPELQKRVKDLEARVEQLSADGDEIV